MRVTFVTTNKHKYEEVSAILKPYGVDLEHLNQSYDENHDLSLDEIARSAAKKLAGDLARPIILEDTGLYFEAYPGFPGVMPKFVIQTLGFKGIFKLLAGENRKAYFKTVAAFAMPEAEPVLFEGVMRGTITDKIVNEGADLMPYDHIFVPEGQGKTIAEMTLEEKNALSHRGIAFRAFGEYVRSGLKDKK